MHQYRSRGVLINSCMHRGAAVLYYGIQLKRSYVLYLGTEGVVLCLLARTDGWCSVAVYAHHFSKDPRFVDSLEKGYFPWRPGCVAFGKCRIVGKRVQ